MLWFGSGDRFGGVEFMMKNKLCEKLVKERKVIGGLWQLYCFPNVLVSCVFGWL